ncbi:beta-galactosidase trimerization domain-containing protein [Mobilitalea sibirica]|uniref:Beta-galactosidase trimerization domain-containing protein n=1 Tax=Mobilitalea sibirica TaxID=1462919 RepID=A0A8J7H0C9_9FIRM|nr:beta-galactosidase trimerization domain-containing protein [Mobilitalea sibirica]MBH1939493.1 beta-galactosidase trimerization domain-containing protein [Mobilitalea sibirica]
MAWWENYPWRMIQTNLREIDMEDINAEQFVKDLLDFKANVVLLNAAGIIASYPTKLPYHYQSSYLHGDSLKDIVDLCHKNGIKVLARTDFSKVRRTLYEQHPQWAFRTKDGQVMDYNGDVQCCINGDYQQKYAFEILKEMFETIPFDGLFCNMGGFQTKDYDFKDYGYCHCDNCKRKFRELYGQDLPEAEDYNNPVYGQYLQFQDKILKEYRERMVAFVKGINKEICFDDEAYARIEAATEYKTRLPHWQYHASSNCRVIIGDGTSNIICSNTTVEYIGYAFRHVSVTPALQELRLWQNLVNLGALDYYLIGRIDNHLDRSSFQRIKKVFAFHAKHEQAYTGLKSKAKILMKRTHRWVASPEEKGWIRTLTESHIPFAEVLPTEFMDVDLSRYQLLLLPDIKFVSKEEADKIDDYVKNGGRVIATGETGLYDPYTGIRDEQVIKSLGVERINSIRHDMVSSMFLVEAKDKKIFTSYADTDVIPVGDSFIHATVKEDAEKFLKLIPPHRYGPPERCYFTEITDTPGVTKYNFGKGYAVYIPWMPGTFYNLGGHSNTFWFMQDILMNLCDIKSIAKSLNPMVEVSLSERSNGNLFVQFVNNSGCFGLSFFDPVPMYHLKLEIPVPKEPKSMNTLKSGQDVSYEYKDQIAYILLDELQEYEAIEIMF